MQDSWVVEAVGLDNSPEINTGSIASGSTRFTYHECARPEHYSPMPITEMPKRKIEQSPPPEVGIDLEGCDKLYASASASNRKSYILAENVSHTAGNPIQDIDTKNHVYPSTAWKTFQNKFLTMPPEICKIIMDMLFEDTFGPRDVHPNTDSPVTNMFLCLDKQLYRKYSQVYWSKNLWIVGVGAANESMRFMTMPPYDISTSEFSRQVPNNAALKIRRVELCFSKEDLPRPLDQGHTTRLPSSSDGAEHPESIHSFDTFDEYKRESKMIASALKQIWQDKFDRVAFLELEYFRLDVMQAYAPDGAFLGVEVVRRLLPFVYGMPEVFEVVAPTGVLEGEVRRGFGGVNEGV